MSLNNLASLYTNMGRYKDAEPLYKQVLAIREKAFGKNHPKVANVLEDMSALYKKMGKDADAKKLDARVKEIR